MFRPARQTARTRGRGLTRLRTCPQGRLKSLYGLRRKMKRKGIPLQEVCDVRALRVIIGDNNGASTQVCRGSLSQDSLARTVFIRFTVHELALQVQ